MIKGNKGEWSEIYTLLKIIADKELYAGDKDLNKIENLVYPIIKILRKESNGIHEYTYEDSIVVAKYGEEEFRISITEFHKQAVSLFNSLKKRTQTTFTLPEVEEFINSFKCTSLKAGSSKKTDIQIVVHDHLTGLNPLLGFSIKSQLGSPSTLLNAGRTTNFIYKIDNLFLSDLELNNINSINTKYKIKDRIRTILDNGGVFNFIKTENRVFSNNLVLIDSLLPYILSDIVYVYYTSPLNTMSDLVDETAGKNPVKYDTTLNHPFYSYKIKRFLSDIALGMMPSKIWDGKLDATGGYLVVKEDGDILCYHIYNRNDFEEYLLSNTRLDTAGSTKHDFGVVYKEGEDLFFKLNLQIRFVK